MAGNNIPGSKKNQRFFYQADNPIEVIKDFGIGVVKSAAQDVVGGVISNATEQLGLTPRPKIEGTLNPNQDLNIEQLLNKEKRAPHPVVIEKTFRPVEQPLYSARDIEIQRKIEEILRELKLLAKAVEKVNQDAGKIVMQEMPPRAGVYHLNFFEWLLKIIKTAREKVEESATWLRLFRSRKKERLYWAMFKKHGTTFGLSHERVLATQTG